MYNLEVTKHMLAVSKCACDIEYINPARRQTTDLLTATFIDRNCGLIINKRKLELYAHLNKPF